MGFKKLGGGLVALGLALGLAVWYFAFYSASKEFAASVVSLAAAAILGGLVWFALALVFFGLLFLFV